MNTFLIKTLMYVVGKFIGAGLFEAVKEIVLLYVSDTTLTGAEKKAAVLAALKKLRGDQKAALLNAGGNLVNLAIEAAVVWAKAKVGVK